MHGFSPCIYIFVSSAYRNGAFYAQDGSTFRIANTQFLYNLSPDGAGGAAVTLISCSAG